MSEILLGKELGEVEALVTAMGQPRFRARQACEWLYKKHAGLFMEMANLPKALRDKLELDYEIGRVASKKAAVSGDGTRKYLFKVDAGYVESAVIPDDWRATLCLSTQVGCARACTFCATGRQGLQGSLTAGEILNQYASCPQRDDITNVVYMGMGEPFDNTDAVLKSLRLFTAKYAYAKSPLRFTVSTVGVIPGMKRFLDETRCHLAISLHSPFGDERAQLMPVEKQYPAADVIEVLRGYDFSGQRRLTFEYIPFKGVNDTPRHAQALVKLLNKLNCRVNLVPFNGFPGAPLEPSDAAAIEQFQNLLKDKGVVTTIRKSKGQDIQAACGLLSTDHMLKIS
ncbi:MAG: 23S rRNA (adenine(2503)-C(2))-methyltransferase RlmN [Kiritimatiellae bacterium]|nr:23S rRNA (adenine(2503)-C(2))-methyltransferase RlmN [Kiritimatiellia bacterium]